jgi:hypothetical protein
MKGLFKNNEQINESKNKFKTEDFPEGSKILFNDGEEWIVVKPGMRGSSNRLKSDEISAKPFNKLAKDRNVSLPVDFSLNYLNDNVKKISESVDNTEEINEGREQIKRKYAEHGAIRVNETAPVRNEILRFVDRRFITEEEMTNFLTKLSENRGKDLNAKLWFERNSKYFEKFENRGQQVWTLSKYGSRVLEFIKKSDSSKGKINESVGLFKI